MKLAPPNAVDDDFDWRGLEDIEDPLADAPQGAPPPLRAKPSARPRTRSEVAMVRRAALAVSVLYQVAWVALLARRSDLPTMAHSTLFAETAVPLAVAGCVVALALAPGPSGMGLPKRRLTALTLAASLLFVFGALLLGPNDIDTQPFLAHALGCFAWTLLLSSLPFAAVVWAFRRVFVVAPGSHLAALAVGCGALAATTMSVLCSVGSPWHVIVGHGSTMLLGGIAGALLGRRVGEA